MAYLIDSDVFIQAKDRHYGLDFCPAFWDWLLQANAAGKLFSVKQVGDELTGHVSTLDAWRAFAQKDSNAATIWLERLAAIDGPMIWNVLDQVPPHRMSQVSREFTYALLLENQRRLLAGEEDS